MILPRAKHNLNTPESYALLRRDPGERGPYDNWSHTPSRGSSPERHTHNVHMLLGTHAGPGWFHSSLSRSHNGGRQTSSYDLCAAVPTAVSPAVSAAIPSATAAATAARTTATPATAGKAVLQQLRRARQPRREILFALRVGCQADSVRELSTISTTSSDNINNELDNPPIDTLIYIFCVIYRS